ncbi:hypothetical protein J1C67_00010 [Clostridium gasigenes]|uniref:hypothetical protein n=1 Tax=Clostridium gasigenes TaxID=94869 RepID=UPI0014385031|nr:hypothetical protein [Clostridium gasigenes]NKF07119.1 hypothetical protein [Clostridium gasigenes]QSW19630.1 hypothetical protein J1C67_00010 [Clostridium gasigenes]
MMPINFPFGQKSTDEIYANEKAKYTKSLEKIFCYNYYQDESYDVLMFKIKYLKHKNSMFLPSKLFFSEKPEYIEYEIKSKHYPDIIKDKYEMKK